MPSLKLVTGAEVPVVYRFDSDLVTVGRAPGNDLVIADRELSRVHLELRREADGWVVRDRRSRNGSRLNGRRIEAAERLVPGDRIELGRQVLVFEPGGAPEGAGTPGDGSTWGMPGEVAGFVGESAAVRELTATARRIASSDLNVLLGGESGTGKGELARLIHRSSPRAAQPFVTIDCPALPGTLLESELFGIERGVATGVEARVGRLEAAQGGTVFLDEVGDLDASAQSKLLQFLQERTVQRLGGRSSIAVDVRILAATHHDLEAEAKRGVYRTDLYYRLNGISLLVPPLRERRDDIPCLVEHFLGRPGGPRATVSPEALALLVRHDYPGNVRELEQLIWRARLLADGGVIAPRDLPAALRASAGGPSGGEAQGRYERVLGGESFWDVVAGPYLRRELPRREARELIRRAHREAGGSYKAMARLLGMPSEHKRLLNFLQFHRLRIDDSDGER